MVLSGHRFEGSGRIVSISEKAWCTWNNYRQVHPDSNESFGVLIGSTSLDRRAIYVKQVTTPLPADLQTRCSFTLQDPQHQREVDSAHAKSGSSQIYLGTWHTHPDPIPSPSRVDKADWRKCIFRNVFRPLVFIIVGTRQTHVYVPVGLRFRQLRNFEY